MCVFIRDREGVRPEPKHIDLFHKKVLRRQLGRVDPGSCPPGPPADPDVRDYRIRLFRRLLEYEHFREVAYVLANAESERALHFGKGYIPPRSAPDLAGLPLELSLEQLVEVAVSLPAPLLKRPHRAPVRLVTVDQKIELLFDALKKKARLTLQAFVGRWKTRMHAVMSFLACLELAKRGKVKLRQEKHFSNLWVYPSEDDENS